MLGWKAWVLSQAGKTVLVKSNLGGIPLFIMHGVKTPNDIVKRLIVIIEISFGII